MSLLYISILWLCACVDSAEPDVTVSAQVGSTVILPCNLTEEFKPTSVIRWQFNFKTVFERSGNVTDPGPGYKGRVDVPVDKLRKGNCSLVLKNIRFTDTGIYNSFTMEHVDTNKDKMKEINRVSLSVDALQISAPVGSTAVLPCDWSHLSNKTPHVKWFTDTETVFERKGKEINQSEGHKGRVDVPEDELLKGNCSLVMNISVNDTGNYSSSMLITDTQESVLVQKVNLSVVEGSVNASGSSSKDSDSHQTGERNRIILYVVIVIIIICVSVYYGSVKVSSCLRRVTDSTEQDRNNTTTVSVLYTTVATQPQT
ncbi:uncharacterized protein LOC113650973 [Tachysurus fulvidraco]|uniref:uncharacterized protein LOC113650973 n=1 Tax=Tachysurus fulvidraco TaxID=1234273 RepID=UPI001FF017A6|nr:uncharacterized protein LOC113650973 [Tachysurus fulvidraco]